MLACHAYKATGALSRKQAPCVVTVSVADNAIVGVLGAKLLDHTWTAFEIPSQSFELSP